MGLVFIHANVNALVTVKRGLDGKRILWTPDKNLQSCTGFNAIMHTRIVLQIHGRKSADLFVCVLVFCTCKCCDPHAYTRTYIHMHTESSYIQQKICGLRVFFGFWVDAHVVDREFFACMLVSMLCV